MTDDPRDFLPPTDSDGSLRLDRRRLLLWTAALGTGALTSSLAAVAAGEGLTPEILADAERVAGLSFTEEERQAMVEGLEGWVEAYGELRSVPLANSVPPALRFDPEPPGVRAWPRGPNDGEGAGQGPVGRSREALAEAADPEAEGFASLASLEVGLRSGAVTAEGLARRSLELLERHDPELLALVRPLTERALEAAGRADRELAAGRHRGPLHGIPWGAKDLLAVAGTPTTWGARPFEGQVLEETATAVERLDEAGAVLVAKLSLGALAMGDVWFGGKTRNPWNPEQGSSGSSAGSAAAVAAGLVPFALGSETLGSIVSPCTRCGATGLRPTFGRVSRHGAMALSWSMDKLGPIARSVDDCARVFAALHGADPRDGSQGDPSAVDRPFAWPPRLPDRPLRVGYVPAAFEDPLPEDADEAAREARAHEVAVLEVLESLPGGPVELVPFALPGTEGDLPVDALAPILFAEAATAFDDLTLSNRDDELVSQGPWSWPNLLRRARLIPAVEYLRAQRVRTLLQERMAEALAPLDLFVTPSFWGSQLLTTNLTGHPAVVLPNGFRTDGTPTSITFVGHLYGEERLLAAARLYQEATDHHRRRPVLSA